MAIMMNLSDIPVTGTGGAKDNNFQSRGKIDRGCAPGRV